jgi:hypothetical protein
MYEALQDRIFWIYFIITFFFIVIGVYYLSMIGEALIFIVGLLWIISNLCLLILIYYASVKWNWEDDTCSDQKCNTIETFLGNETGISKGIIFFIHVLFLTMLVVSNLWAFELQNNTNTDNNNTLQSIYGILLILGGLLLTKLSLHKSFDMYAHISPFWVSIIYLVTWFGLTIYYSIL